MRMWETGILNDRIRDCRVLARLGGRAPRTAGFTLIEIMVVLVIIAVLAGFAVLSVRGRDNQSVVNDEATRLAALFTMAREDALFRYRTLGARLTRRQSDFFLYSNAAWTTLEDELFSTRNLPEDASYSLYLEGRPLALDVEASDGKSDGEGEIDTTEIIPQIIFFADGLGTPFELTVNAEGAKPRTVKGNAAGDIEVEPLEQGSR